MFQFPTASTLSALAVAVFLVAPGLAQTGSSTESGSINVKVSFDPSRTGDERCSVEPEDLWLPKGPFEVTWSMERRPSGSDNAGSGPRLESVDFPESVPVVSNARVSGDRWRASFNREQSLEMVPYTVHLKEANGEMIECYPHVAGSTDQGGGGGG